MRRGPKCEVPVSQVYSEIESACHHSIMLRALCEADQGSSDGHKIPGGRAPGCDGLQGGHKWQLTDTEQPQTTSHRRGEFLAPIASVLGPPLPKTPGMDTTAVFPPSPAPTCSFGSQMSAIECPTPARETHSEPRLLVIPEIARTEHGGCVDTSSMFFQLVQNDLGYLQLEDLLTAYFKRTPRPEYGETHTSTRGNCGEDGLTLFFERDTCLGANAKSKSNNDHKLQEQMRRIRHRQLASAAYDCTPDASLDMAERHLPTLKKTLALQHIEEMKKRIDIPKERSSAANRAGKDDQILAGTLQLYFSQLVVMRLMQDRDEALRQRSRLERENADMAHELAFIRQQSRRGSAATFSSTWTSSSQVCAKRRIDEDEDDDVQLYEEARHRFKRQRAELHHQPRYLGQISRRPLTSPCPSDETSSHADTEHRAGRWNKNGHF